MTSELFRTCLSSIVTAIPPTFGRLNDWSLADIVLSMTVLTLLWMLRQLFTVLIDLLRKKLHL